MYKRTKTVVPSLNTGTLASTRWKTRSRQDNDLKKGQRRQVLSADAQSLFWHYFHLKLRIQQRFSCICNAPLARYWQKSSPYTVGSIVCSLLGVRMHTCRTLCNAWQNNGQNWTLSMQPKMRVKPQGYYKSGFRRVWEIRYRSNPARWHWSTRLPGHAFLAWRSSWRLVKYIYVLYNSIWKICVQFHQKRYLAGNWPVCFLKVPKCEIFDPFFFTPIHPIWVGDLRTGEKKFCCRRLRQIFAIFFFTQAEPALKSCLRRLSLR